MTDGAPAWEEEGQVFIEHLAKRERAAAIVQAVRLLDDGVPSRDVVTRLLGPAQREVGRRWEIGAWSVAQEHLATGITDDVLQVVSSRTPTASAPRAHVAVACVEGEYHAMPARMLTEVLRGLGFAVNFFGASMPADALSSMLAETHPVALALSCSLTSHLVEAARGIGVAHRHGIPVIVGGAAFGATDERARALGADAWSATAEGAAQVLDRWALAAPRTFGAALALGGDHIDIAEQRSTLIEQAMALALSDESASPGDDPRRRSRLRVQLSGILDNLASSVKLNDAAVLRDVLLWPRQDSGLAADRAADAVARVLPPSLGRAHRLLAEARRLALPAARDAQAVAVAADPARR